MLTERLAQLKRTGLFLGRVLAVTGTVSGARADEGLTKGTALAPNVPSKTRVVHLSDDEIEAFLDRRFFAGGEYFVDTSRNPKTTAEVAPNGKHQFERKVAVGPR